MSKVITSGLKALAQDQPSRFTDVESVMYSVCFEQIGTHSSYYEFNISSLVDGGAGDTRINYGSVRTNINQPEIAVNANFHCRIGTSRNTSATRIDSLNSGNAQADTDQVNSIGFGEPA